MFVAETASFPGLTRVLDNATFLSSSATPTIGNYVTIAQADPTTQTVTLYAPYFQQNSLAQSQTLVHESMHRAFGLGDQHLGQAATGRAFDPGDLGRAAASAAFQGQLKKHCK